MGSPSSTRCPSSTGIATSRPSTALPTSLVRAGMTVPTKGCPACSSWVETTAATTGTVC